MIGDVIWVVLHREERGVMITGDRSDIIMMVVPTHIFPERNESYLWIIFPFSD